MSDLDILHEILIIKQVSKYICTMPYLGHFRLLCPKEGL